MNAWRQPRSRRVALPLLAATELIATLRCACWPLAKVLYPIPEPTQVEGNPLATTAIHPTTSRHSVVLVHGYLGHPDMFRPLRRRLYEAGYRDVTAVRYASTRADLPEIASAIDAVISPIVARSGPVDLVGHSLGAVACRAYIKVFGGAGNVHRFVSLGGPHAGTALYRFTPPQLWAVLDPDGPWVRRLRQGDDPVPTIVIRSRYDHQVLPPIRAALPGAEEIVLTGTGHNGLLWSSEAHREVISALDRAT